MQPTNIVLTFKYRGHSNEKIITSLLLSTCAVSTYSFAEESWLNWQSNSISALYGKGFEVEPDTHETITFEHASNWKWGDLFLFVDTYWFDGEKTASQGHNAVYTEIAPRFQ